MKVFPWARRPDPERIVKWPAHKPFYLVSDVHLGDGTRSDAFVGKDRELLAFLEAVGRSGAHLVINGDIIDFSQALTFTRVVRAHGEIFRALSELAAGPGVTYVWGNHDLDIALYRDLLRWEVCSAIEVGDDLIIRHGHQMDPYIYGNMRHSALVTLLHHQYERIFRTWVRTPLEDFYTLSNRLTWWSAARALALSRWLVRLLRKARLPAQEGGLDSFLAYWFRSQMGDPMNLFPGARRALLEGRRPVLICGHSHLPGKVTLGENKTYVNSGSWTFRNANYVRWTDQQIEVSDWITGRIYGDELYQPLVDGRVDAISFAAWWEREYKGWLRFESGELRRKGLPVTRWYLTREDSEERGEERQVSTEDEGMDEGMEMITDAVKEVKGA